MEEGALDDLDCVNFAESISKHGFSDERKKMKCISTIIHTVIE